MRLRRPNFFILGAPKCGTTSLSAWLDSHPSIFMSPIKEPHFFNDDENYVLTCSVERYEGLFAKATPSHQWIGEASVWYLHSRSAVRNIEAYSPDARYIVLLRNPTEMAYSLHEELLVNGSENIRDFEAAWRVSDLRLEGKSVSRLCREPRHLAYANVCKIGSQLERLLGEIDDSRVLPLVLDDIKDNPRREYLKVLKFLCVSDNGRTEFPVHNSAKELRSSILKRSTMLSGHIKNSLGISRGFGILAAINRGNVRYRERQPLSPGMRQELNDHFRSEIELLGQIMGRSFSDWLLD